MVVAAILIGIITCIAPIAILVLIISAIVKKNKEDKNNFESTVRNIYVYIILIITLIAIIIGVIATFRIGLDLALPEKSTYQSSYTTEERERNENIIELVTTIALLVTVTPIFKYHNKLAKQERIKKTQEQQSQDNNQIDNQM